jgi:hypothetical protein
MANTIGYGQGSVNNTNAWGQGAKSGSSFSNLQSLEFDGIDDYVIANVDGTSTGGVLASADTDINATVSLWFKVQSLPSVDKGFFQWANTLTSGSPFLLFQISLPGYLRIYTDGSYRFTQSISINTWYNIILIRTSSTNIWTCYLNGTSIGTYNDSGVVSNRANASSIYLGNGYNGYINGFIDEVAIWNNDRTSDVSTIYNNGVPNDISSLNPLGWWRFEGTGTTATDSGSGGNNGTLTNGVTRSSDVPT